MKLPLRKVLGKARISYEEMETVLFEVEAVINSRPLTYLYDDDVLEPLTPSYLLTGRSITQGACQATSEAVTAQSLMKRVKYLQALIQLFWTQFRSSYLAELRDHHMYQSKCKITSNKSLQVDDVVVVKDDDFAPRNTWRIARVESLVTGPDGEVRGGGLATVTKDGRRTKITRPVQKLVPLEVNSVKEKIDNAVINDPTIVDQEPNITPLDQEMPNEDGKVKRGLPDVRSKRVAATKGETIRRAKKMK